MENITPCREKISPGRILFPDYGIVFLHDVKHGIMKYNIMLGMAFGITDIQNAMIKVYVLHPQQAGFICPNPATVKKAEKYGDCDSSGPLFLREASVRNVVACIKEIFQFIPCKCMRDVGSSLYFRNFGFPDICFSTFSQITDEADNNIDPGSA
jgi:hypothetical protein